MRANEGKGRCCLGCQFLRCRRISNCRYINKKTRAPRNVKRWRSPEMIRRWTALGVITAEEKFRRIKGTVR